MQRSGTLSVALAAGLALLASCATQRQYDDAVELAKNYQSQLLEKDQQISRLQSENDQLRRAKEMSSVASLSEAGYGDELQSRLSELQAKIDGLGRPLNDVERIDVDGGYVLLVQDKILFDSGSADLSGEGKKRLAEIAGQIEGTPHGRIQVRGHTDSDKVSKPATKEKFPHGNLQLSAARAIEVASALISSGKVDAKDVAVAGFGQYDPIRPNDNAENKRLNRRVEIFVADRSGAKASTAATSK